ncbi:MAG: hypothetical protein KBB11_05480 [Bacteroidales bacterium]|nr:hypothetical protein [Bacteroidales bacterium]HOY39061.1 hypothetical protein [Bacteroidales bacterium]HQN93879.1 hypothetical protein [Prolixibacteraceae bacterium]
MSEKLLIGVLGHYHAGKSTTWNSLFQRVVRTGKHERTLVIGSMDIPVFLINGAPLERKTELKKILPKDDPTIVLCSFLYHKNVIQNFEYFIKKGYQIYIQWLNPGFSDEYDASLFYQYGIIDYLLNSGATVSVQNGKINPEKRVEMVQNYLLGWYYFYIEKNCEKILNFG